MNGILNAMQGGYGYLLIGQILVICALSLAMIWLLVRRLLEVGELSGSAMPVATAAPTIIDNSAEFAEEMASLKDELERLRGELGQRDGEKKKLTEKIQYLESKLLEYEILQEEIGTLSALKLENEQLRETVSRLEAQGSGGYSDRAREQRKAAPKAPQSAPGSEKASQEEIDQAILAASLGKVPDVAQEAEEKKASTPEEDTGLAGLIAQIDELTAQAKTSDKKKTG